MVATWNVAATSSYYARGQEYYLGGPEPDGVWYSRSAEFDIVDSASVKTDRFEALYQGSAPSGRSLLIHAGANRLDRTPAFDITLSAPRSVSLIWAFSDTETRTAIEHAQERAARHTLDMLGREAAYARRGRNGQVVEKVSLTAALFQHGESRPAEHADGQTFGDPNLHTHCVVMNLATRADGTIGALHSTVLRDWKMAAGATYHAALAAELNELGFAVDRIGKNGIFEIAGVNDADIVYFSARRCEIENVLATAGVQSGETAALAAAVAKATRNTKAGLSQSDRRKVWGEAALANGVESVALASTARQAQREASLADPETLLRDHLSSLPRDLTETESVIDRRELFRAVSAALVGTGFSAVRADVAFERLLQSGAFVEIGRDVVGQAKYSTPEMIALEQELVDHAKYLARRSWSEISADRISAAGLSAEQTEAARAATSPQAINIIEGAPGSGKTTTLAPIVNAYRLAGYRVVGAATAWRVAKTLQDDLKIEARATASWFEGLNHGRKFLDNRSVLIVDEAGLLSSREMHGLLSEARSAGAKVVLVGDRRQLQAIGAGPGFELAMRAVEASRVDTIVRQKQAWARDAVTAFGAGDAEAALAAFAANDRLSEASDYKSAVNTLAAEWVDQKQQKPEITPLLIARTNAQVADLSRVVREKLKDAGDIRGTEFEFDAATPSGRTARMALAVGDEIRFLTRNHALGVINGSVGKVSAVSERDGSISIEAKVDSRSIRFTPSDIADDKGRARMGWAYASTVYGCQGMTVDQAFVLLDASYDRHAIHVAVSRAREETRLVIDRTAIDTMLALNQPLDCAGKPPDASCIERQAFLAERLSRASAKSSTIAIIEAARSPTERRQEVTPTKTSPSQVSGAKAIEPKRGLEHEL